LPRETRKNVRRSEKRGVEIVREDFSDDLVGGILEIQNECFIRQGRRYPHYGKTFNQVKRDQSTFVERSDFICAYFEDELIGFLKLVHRGDVASILQLLSKSAHYDKRPANALIAKAVEICEGKGVNHLIYGGFNYEDASLGVHGFLRQPDGTIIIFDPPWFISDDTPERKYSRTNHGTRH